METRGLRVIVSWPDRGTEDSELIVKVHTGGKKREPLTHKGRRIGEIDSIARSTHGGNNQITAHGTLD